MENLPTYLQCLKTKKLLSLKGVKAIEIECISRDIDEWEAFACDEKGEKYSVFIGRRSQCIDFVKLVSTQLGMLPDFKQGRTR